MGTHVGVGFSKKTESRDAAIDAARAALERSGSGTCDLVLMFSTSKHDPVSILQGVRSVVGPRPRIVGGYAVGLVTHDDLSYGGSEFGLAVLSSDSVKIDVFIQQGIDKGELEAGQALGKQLAARSFKDPNLILMYDAIRKVGKSLNMATPLLEGMGRSLGTWPRTAGVGMFGDLSFGETHQWYDDRVERQSALALVLSGGIRMDTVIAHGCRPAGSYHKITRTDGPVVLEIDGRPALSVISELLGSGSGMTPKDFPLFVTLGVNKGDKFEAFKEENYANRLCIGIDADRAGLVMFEPDLKPGMDVQLMRRSIGVEYMKDCLDAITDRIGSRRPVFALYIDCAGRAKALCGMEQEEAAEVQKWARSFNSPLPLLGIYSGVEIAKVGADMQALDWTGVLNVFSV